jgi:hypothetical protein
MGALAADCLREVKERGMKPKLSGYFFKHPREMYDSPAFKVLNINERRCLDCLEHEVLVRKLHNTDLVITHRKYADYGVVRRLVMPSLRVLQELGFVKCTEHGRGGHGNYRRPNKWQLTYAETAPKKNDATHEWRAITTQEQAEAIARQHRSQDKRKRHPPSRRRPRLRVIKDQTDAAGHTG